MTLPLYTPLSGIKYLTTASSRSIGTNLNMTSRDAYWSPRPHVSFGRRPPYAEHIVCQNGGSYSTPFEHMVNADTQCGTAYHQETMDCKWAVPANDDAVRCRESLNRFEWERNFYKKSCKRQCSPSSRTASSLYEEPEQLVEKDIESQITRPNSTNLSTSTGGRLPTVVPRNSAGQRIDLPVTFDKDLRSKMRAEQWCSNHHLKGHCSVQGCYFRHGSLDHAGKSTLLSLTRGNYCRNGNCCDIADCYAGHQCPYVPCRKEESCHFPPDMHIADRLVVNVDMPPSSRSPRRRRSRR